MQKYGLTTAQAAEARKKYGSNALSAPPRATLWNKLWENFQDPMIKILLLALLVNADLALILPI